MNSPEFFVKSVEAQTVSELVRILKKSMKQCITENSFKYRQFLKVKFRLTHQLMNHVMATDHSQNEHLSGQWRLKDDPP